jgi:hypothetical protein
MGEYPALMTTPRALMPLLYWPRQFTLKVEHVSKEVRIR